MLINRIHGQVQRLGNFYRGTSLSKLRVDDLSKFHDYAPFPAGSLPAPRTMIIAATPPGWPRWLSCLWTHPHRSSLW